MRTPTAAVPFALLAAALASAGGCVERKLVIRSDPPGAIVHLEDEEQPQRTPLEVPFHWDGVRRVRLQAPGHRVLETTAEITPRWFDWFPLDIASDLLWPGTITDVRTFDYVLEPYRPVEGNLTDAEMSELRERLADLRSRAEDHRRGGSEGPATAVAASPPEQAPPPPPPPRAAPPSTGKPSPEKPSPATPAPEKPADLPPPKPPKPSR